MSWPRSSLARLVGLGQRGPLAALVRDLRLELLDLAAQPEERLVALGENALAFGQVEASLGDGRFAFGEARLGGGDLVAEPRPDRRARARSRSAVRRARRRRARVRAGVGSRADACTGRPCLACRSIDEIWRRISPSTSVTRSRFCSVASSLRSASRRRALYLLMPAASSISMAAFFGLRGDDLGDATLLDDRVALGPDPRVAEEVVDVAQTARASC